MAQRRMFSPDIVASDAFLDMPPSTQALYFQFGMRADDDGFVNPKFVMRMIGSTEDELKVLIAKKFVVPFDNGVIVIKHWRINNFIRKDRYKETVYLEQKNSLNVKQNGSYTTDLKQGEHISIVPWKSDEEVKKDIKYNVKPTGQPTVNQRSTQVRLGKVRLGKEIHVANATIFSFEEKIQLMKTDPDKRMLIIAFYWYFKKWEFDNEDQYHAALKRELRAATNLKGFSIKEISAVMEYCSKEYKVWTLETVFKRITDLKPKKDD